MLLGPSATPVGTQMTPRTMEEPRLPLKTAVQSRLSTPGAQAHRGREARPAPLAFTLAQSKEENKHMLKLSCLPPPPCAFPASLQLPPSSLSSPPSSHGLPEPAPPSTTCHPVRMVPSHRPRLGSSPPGPGNSRGHSGRQGVRGHVPWAGEGLTLAGGWHLESQALFCALSSQQVGSPD